MVSVIQVCKHTHACTHLFNLFHCLSASLSNPPFFVFYLSCDNNDNEIMCICLNSDLYKWPHLESALYNIIYNKIDTKLSTDFYKKQQVQRNTLHCVFAAGKASEGRGQRGGVADEPHAHGPKVTPWCHPSCCYGHSGHQLQPAGVLGNVPCSGALSDVICDCVWTAGRSQLVSKPHHCR